MTRGLTLIEILAAVAIFSIIIGAISGLFISAIRSQGRVLATQEILDQASYAMEYMGRAIRMARKDLNDDCIPAESNYETSASRVLDSTTYSGPGLEFMNYKGICQEFFLDTDDNRLKEIKAGYTAPLPLTSSELQVNSLNFNLSGETQADDLQPRVTIFLELLGRGASGAEPKIQIQTSISQRTLDVEY